MDHLAQQLMPGADKLYINFHFEIQLSNIRLCNEKPLSTECYDIVFVPGKTLIRLMFIVETQYMYRRGFKSTLCPPFVLLIILYAGN